MGDTMDTSARFDLRLEREKARVLLEREQRIALSPRDMAALTAALDDAFAPNKALRAAIKRAPRDRAPCLRSNASIHAPLGG